MKKPWYRKSKKTIIRDAKTGEEYELSSPRYGRRKRKECLGGCLVSGFPRLHDSVEEACLCNKLRVLKKVREIKDYRPQVTYQLTDASGKNVGYHRVDFVVEMNDGTKKVWEYKGAIFETLPEYRMKKALFSWNYPDVVYEVKTVKDLL